MICCRKHLPFSVYAPEDQHYGPGIRWWVDTEDPLLPWKLLHRCFCRLETLILKHTKKQEGSEPSEKWMSSPAVWNRIKWCNQSFGINCWNTRTDWSKTLIMLNIAAVHDCCKEEIRTTLDTIPFWRVSFRSEAKRY